MSETGPLEIQIDRDACSGARACILRAAHTFALDEAKKAVVTDPNGDPEQAILDAARSCPNFAIELARNGSPIA
jgi:ferredoxin